MSLSVLSTCHRGSDQTLEEVCEPSETNPGVCEQSKNVWQYCMGNMAYQVAKRGVTMITIITLIFKGGMTLAVPFSQPVMRRRKLRSKAMAVMRALP